MVSKSPTPVDMDLYNKVKAEVYKRIPKHSAYRSGILVQEYKQKFREKHKHDKSYSGKKTKKKGLKRWFDEKWVNQRGEIGYKYKSDIYRPSKKITKKTPLTHGEITNKELSRARNEKYKKGRINRFRKQNQTGGKWTRKYKRSINCRKPKGFSQKQYCKYSRKREIPKLRTINYSKKKHRYKLNHSAKKRRRAIRDAVKMESKKTKKGMKEAALAKKRRFNVLRIYRKNGNSVNNSKNKKECNILTKDMQYMDKKYNIGDTTDICN